MVQLPAAVPPALWSAPVPLIALAADWHLHWTAYRQRLHACDLILADALGVQLMARAGFRHAEAATLPSLGADLAPACSTSSQELGARERDIDILVAAAPPSPPLEKLDWIPRLARLGLHRRVVIRPEDCGAPYREALGRARIVFNPGSHGDSTRRAFEAVAAGALLFQHAAHRDLAAIFTDRQDAVFFTDDNFENLLDYYLDHEDERRRIAQAGHARIAEFSFDALWDKCLKTIEADWPTIVDRAGRRTTLRGRDDLLIRTAEAIDRPEPVDPALVQDLAAALVRQPSDSILHNALGLAVSAAAKVNGLPDRDLARQAVGYFQRAVACDPANVVAGLNLSAALAQAEQSAAALEQARRTLAIADRLQLLPPCLCDGAHFPPRRDFFHATWERAGWEHAGQTSSEAAAKLALVRWRLHGLLGMLSGDPLHAFEAAMIRPDLPASHAILGWDLRRTGKPGQAAVHLRHALDADPLDANTAEELFHSLGESGNGFAQRILADERRLLAQAAPKLVPMREWMVKLPPPGDELASIIILCCNQVDYTRRCLDSVFKHTRQPYELVLVDNGSTDATPQFLQQIVEHVSQPAGPVGHVSQRALPQRVVILRNETNRGFAAGCNQALAQARGRYLVFLNNDTLVTPHWLDGLIRWSLVDWPRTGMVGPMSDCAPSPQLVPVSFHDLTFLDAFADQRRRQFAGQALQTPRLTGFCLLVRREVLKQIGAFDEDFGLGFFEDDDLCVRARAAGFQLLAALDVFIHHVGSRTFAALGLNTETQLQANFARFRSKWGDEHTAGYQLVPGGQRLVARTENRISAGAAELTHTTDASLATSHCPPATVSLCMIVKNEQANLAECLASVAGLVNEIVVIDTGSTDKTREIAGRFAAKIHEFPWVDSFAAARNESLKHATGQWAFWMDADDRLDAANRDKLRTLFTSLNGDNAAYCMKCLCPPERPGGPATVVDHVRLFRNHPEIRWQYRVHEQILPAVNRAGSDVRPTGVIIRHVGYLDPALRRRKHDRDMRLLDLDLRENPNDPFVEFNIGWNLEQIGKPAEALPYLQRSLQRSQPSDSIVRKLFSLIMECHRQLGRPDVAMAACQDGRRIYPDDAQLLFQEAHLRINGRDLQGAEQCLLRLIQGTDEPRFASTATDLRGYKAQHLLAVVYCDQGRPFEAEALFRTVLDAEPTFTGAWLGLAELQLGQGQFTELETLIEKSKATGTADGSAVVVMEARLLLARKEFVAARQLLEAVLAEQSQDVLLWSLLSYVLLQEGKDPEAAERVLRKVLELNPGDAEAKKNLHVLLRQQGREETPVAAA